jgi:hypothetical protein
LAEPQRSKAYVGLAFASALIVLLASGVAVSRIGDQDDEGAPVASAPDRAPTGADAGSGDGSGSGSAGSTTPDAGGPGGAGGTAAGAADANAATEASSKGSGQSTDSKARNASGTVSTAAGQRNPGASGSGAAGTQGEGSQTNGAQAPPGGGDAGSPQGAEPGGSQGGGQGSPPAPSQQPPDGDSRLMAASVSVGEGAQGGVVAVASDGASLDAGVTVGDTQLVGNHPPSEGTGVTFGGRFLQPPPFLPSFSG